MNATSRDVPEISVIIPLYNEVDALPSVIERLRPVLEGMNRLYEIIVVDDGSEDSTKDFLNTAGVRVVTHPYNMGNGAAVKTGIRQARGRLLVMMDGDGQHSPEDIPRLIEKLSSYDMVVGARTWSSESSFHRNLANKIYNLFASYMCGRRIEDLTSGFRAIRRDIARRFIYLLPNGFSYPATITLAVVRTGHSLGYIPIMSARRLGKSKIRLLRDGTRFLLIILRIATLFSPMKIFLPVSTFMFLLGFGYGIFRIVSLDGRYGPTSAMLMTMAVVIFMVGLVSEQVAQLRFERSEGIEDDSRQTSRTSMEE
ncbi:MAG: glycosyltransferase family 2 protein [Deltaproteobacteria bacterium]|nr:glycosyltransferase family 2 protein [Deltaproteobacteria bacterium]